MDVFELWLNVTLVVGLLVISLSLIFYVLDFYLHRFKAGRIVHAGLSEFILRPIGWIMHK